MLPLHSRNVLVCLRYGIGDVVMALPAISALRRAIPGARIVALGNPPADEILDGDARVDAVLGTSRWRLSHRWDSGEPGTREALAAWIREQRFDLVLDATHAPTAVGRAVWSLGIRSLEGDPCAEEAALASGESGTEAIRAGVRSGWGLHVPRGITPAVHPRESDELFAASFLAGHGSHAAPSPSRRWPPRR